MTEQILLLIGAFLLVMLNGFFVAAEFALVKVRATKIEELAEQGNRRARVVRNLIQHLDGYLSATQLGITIASLGLGWIGEPAVAAVIAPMFRGLGIASETVIHATSFTIAFTIISFFHIVLGELAPKSLAIRKPEATSLWVALPLRGFYFAMYPAIYLLNGTANWVLRLLGLTSVNDSDVAHSPEELRMIVAASHAHGSLTAMESRLLANVIAFSDRQVAEIMTPRLSMICLQTNKTLGENIAIVREHQHTRYPLADGSLDKVIGIVHVKDLLLLRGLPQGEGGVMRSIMRPASFVPETASVDAALRLIQRRRSLMVIVVDEYGTVAGLMTLEDVLEEIVGPIQDEFDTQEPPGVQREGEDIEVDASMPLSEVAAKMRSLPIPESDRVRTVGGYILKRLGHVPKVGETLTLGRYQVQVIEMDHLRIKRLRFRAQSGRGEQAAARP